MTADTIVQVSDLGFPWATPDPFLFCVYHDDAYPRGNAAMGPDAALEGRELGHDFSRAGGWSMYHGRVVPGFPAHPHRGFETVTVTRQGFVDHSDSLGATARYGAGDVQWLTAGSGIVHSEMLPLRNADAPNPLELFQIWLNLPSRSKMTAPRFTMYWAEDTAHFRFDASGRPFEQPGRHFEESGPGGATLSCIAGVPRAFGGKAMQAPPPDSWAAQPDADVAIWTVKMAPKASLTLPAATGINTRRTLYFFKGDRIDIAGTQISRHSAVAVRADAAVELQNGHAASELLMLQGRPIGEPVVQRGPFVMNTIDEIHRTIEDYRRTQFGGWPWCNDAPVHPRTMGRFAHHPDGRVERPAHPALADAINRRP